MKWPFFTDVISLCIGMIVNTFSFLINKSHKFRILGSNFPQDDMEIIYLVQERVGNSCI